MFWPPPKPTACGSAHTSCEGLSLVPKPVLSVSILRITLLNAHSYRKVDDAATPAEKVKLIIAAFEAFSAVAASFGPSHKEDFRALAITLYCGKLWPITTYSFVLMNVQNS